MKIIVGLMLLSIGSGLFWECLGQPMPNSIAIGILGVMFIGIGLWLLRIKIFTTNQRRDQVAGLDKYQKR